MPAELAIAVTVEALCKRYPGRLPREILAEGTALLRHVNLLKLWEPT